MNKSKLTNALLVTALLVQPTVSAAAPSTAVKTAPKTTAKQTKPTQSVVKTINDLAPIKISSKSTVKLTDVNIFSQDDGNILSFTVTFQNNDNKNILLNDYWTKVKTKTGTFYSVKLISADKDKKTVAPGASTTITYAAKIGKNLKISDIYFQLIRWDFSRPDFEDSIGFFNVPSSYVTSTPVNEVKKIRINNNPVKVKADQFSVYTDGDYNNLSVSLNLQNVGYKQFEDPNLKYVISTASGTNFPLTADTTSKGYNIQAQDNKMINLVARIPKTVSLNNLQLQVIQDDDSLKLSVPVATMQLPKANKQDLVVEAYKDKTINVGSQKIEARIVTAALNQSFDVSDLAIQVMLRNTSSKQVIVPKYNFVIQTESGYSYPIDTKVLDNVTLDPLEEKSIRLTASIPSSLAGGQYKLYMNLPVETEDKNAQFNYSVGIFDVPEPTPMQNALGVENQIQDDNGVYGVTLDSVQRLPWVDGDLVSAKFTIRNKGFKTVQLPELEGVLKVDSAKVSAGTRLVTSQASTLLGPQMETQVYVVTKLPTDLDFSQLQISLNKKVGEESNEWIQLTNLGTLRDLQAVPSGSNYRMNTEGHGADIKERKTWVYEGDTSNIIYTQLEVDNLEDRPVDMSQIVGYFKSSTGQIFKADVNQIDHASSPQGKNIVTLWSKIPKKVSVTDMQLIVGEGITENKLTPIKGTSDGYVNAAAMKLSAAYASSNSLLQNIELFPYTLSIYGLQLSLNDSSTVNVKFNYDLLQNLDYDMGTYEHKLILEIRDSSGEKFEKELVISSDLKVALSQSYSFSMNGSDLDKSGVVQLTLYDEFEGNRIRLGDQVAYYTNSK
ncbi:hypothetical protein PASE110613_08190 [Paenibacillus sediminis]|uniref:DUF11 domain-containing protein n=1 Tax=Paenibacillus sediminis TaxID=664909 RepID=A0ABS4H2B8_9BACL|nr:hypothetical protein [Paenibacillus sediminis]MBP1936677.1 hypothetical protein [Paenibacillus sediminis]